MDLFEKDARGLVDVIRAASQRGVYDLILPSSYDPDAAVAVAAFFSQHAPIADLVVATGDLATSGGGRDLSVASHFFLSSPISGISGKNTSVCVGLDFDKLLVLPGNHDRYSNDLALPAGVNFDLSFKNGLSTVRKSVGHRILGNIEPKLGIVFGDFTLKSVRDAKGLGGHYGQGKAYPATCKEMQRRTFEIRKSEKLEHVIWCVHFAPFDCGSELEFLEGSTFLDAAKSAGVSVVLCGHTHRKSYFEQDGVRVYCAGAATSVAHTRESQVNTIHILNINVGVNIEVVRKDYRFSRIDCEFLLE